MTCTGAPTCAQGRGSEVYGVDAHPGAVLKYGIMLDHATGIVIGEVAAPPRPLLLSSST